MCLPLAGCARPGRCHAASAVWDRTHRQRRKAAATGHGQGQGPEEKARTEQRRRLALCHALDAADSGGFVSPRFRSDFPGTATSRSTATLSQGDAGLSRIASTSSSAHDGAQLATVHEMGRTELRNFKTPLVRATAARTLWRESRYLATGGCDRLVRRRSRPVADAALAAAVSLLPA